VRGTWVDYPAPVPASDELRETLRQTRQAEVVRHVTTARAQAAAGRNSASQNWESALHRNCPTLEDFVRRKPGGGLEPVQPA
jgi:hypothetical protein